MKKGFSFFLCILLLIFLLLSPAMIAAGIGRNIYLMREDDLANDYRGTIEFWHVVSFKTPSGSGYEHLKQYCERFERNTPYVFIELKGLTVDEAKRRMSEGELPDVISCPMGVFSEEGMLELSKPESMLSGLKDAAQSAVPYMMDSYVIVINRGLMRKIDVQEGFSGELSEEMFFDAYMKLTNAEYVPIAATETLGLSLDCVVENIVLGSDESYPTEVAAPSRLEYRIGRELFLDGKAGMYLCPYSEYVLQKKEGYDFDTEAYTITDHTDIVQTIGAYDSGTGNKNEMLIRLAEGVFSEGMQRRLEKISMLPCILLDGIYESDAERFESYRSICEKDVKSR